MCVSAWWFIVVSIFLRIIGGFGAAMYTTVLFAFGPQLFPKHVTVVMVIQLLVVMQVFHEYGISMY